jgi:hypothetical protein
MNQPHPPVLLLKEKEATIVLKYSRLPTKDHPVLLLKEKDATIVLKYSRLPTKDHPVLLLKAISSKHK